jgi:histidyl-tRNA synthetase
MKAADKSGAQFVLVIGDSEIEQGEVTLKRMSDGATTSVKIGQLQAELQSKISETNSQ